MHPKVPEGTRWYPWAMGEIAFKRTRSARVRGGGNIQGGYSIRCGAAAYLGLSVAAWPFVLDLSPEPSCPSRLWDI